MLYTLNQLSNEFPEVVDYLSTKAKEADLKLPTKPTLKTVGNKVNPAKTFNSNSSALGNSRPNSNSIQARNFDLEI